MRFQLKNLPFSMDSLEPYISSRSMSLHYGKHHQAYIDNLNDLLAKSSIDLGDTLPEIIKKSFLSSNNLVFNNASQVWNHDFFWESISPTGGGIPKIQYLQQLIEFSFGSYESFYEEFLKLCLRQFGSGWGWLCYSQKTNSLVLYKTSNAENPLVINECLENSLVPLATCDVWEHAYYTDYQNRRGEFVETFLKHLINWDFVNKNLMNLS
ncbi:superoxide dismutase [Lyticum sinuosum]|uniref:Superoxide dismutase n=1 Tax=Lyticum sinuosum TaxID=1332059 RepID=A0AAE4VKI4_9RICK|nr:superoxide dismutase [Lyticum sinuosum]MDZ5761210.1 Superoxide dismutase [Fe] [Lyticum sinuosum]